MDVVLLTQRSDTSNLSSTLIEQIESLIADVEDDESKATSDALRAFISSLESAESQAFTSPAVSTSIEIDPELIRIGDEAYKVRTYII
jgi:hypothetical protein